MLIVYSLRLRHNHHREFFWKRKIWSVYDGRRWRLKNFFFAEAAFLSLLVLFTWSINIYWHWKVRASNFMWGNGDVRRRRMMFNCFVRLRQSSGISVWIASLNETRGETTKTEKTSSCGFASSGQKRTTSNHKNNKLEMKRFIAFHCCWWRAVRRPFLLFNSRAPESFHNAAVCRYKYNL